MPILTQAPYNHPQEHIVLANAMIVEVLPVPGGPCSNLATNSSKVGQQVEETFIGTGCNKVQQQALKNTSTQQQFAQLTSAKAMVCVRFAEPGHM